LTLNGRSIFLSSVPFCLTTPSSILSTRSLTAACHGLAPREDVLGHDGVERGLVDRGLSGLHRDHVRAAVVQVRHPTRLRRHEASPELRTRRVTSEVMWRSTFRMSRECLGARPAGSVDARAPAGRRSKPSGGGPRPRARRGRHAYPSLSHVSCQLCLRAVHISKPDGTLPAT
jgi:hypothetical protein